jgi:hypothetical protein
MPFLDGRVFFTELGPMKAVVILQGTAFPYAERERLKLRGLLPVRRLTMENQVTPRV